MNGWAIVTASLRDFAAFVSFARQKFNRPLPRSSTPNCHWPHGWNFAGERARPGCRFRRRAASPENSPAIHGWVSLPAISPSPVRDERCLRTATIADGHHVICRPSRDFLILVNA